MHTPEINITVIAIVITIGMLIMALSIVFFILFHQRKMIKNQIQINAIREQQQQLLLHAAIESEEKERQRIAGDLHDEVGASLSTIRLYLLQAAKKKTPEEAASATTAAKEILDEVTKQVRQISHRLSPEMLMKFGLAEALKNMAQKLDGTGSLQVSFRSEADQIRLPPENELAVYRIAQEITGNLMKHAGATEMTMQLMHSGKNLSLHIADNGKGFTQESFDRLKNSPDGLGLKTIQSRVNILEATLLFAPRPGNKPGTLTRLTVPVKDVQKDKAGNKKFMQL